jgi:hypothetical protein
MIYAIPKDKGTEDAESQTKHKMMRRRKKNENIR